PTASGAAPGYAAKIAGGFHRPVCFAHTAPPATIATIAKNERSFFFFERRSGSTNVSAAGLLSASAARSTSTRSISRDDGGANENLLPTKLASALTSDSTSSNRLSRFFSRHCET